MQGAPSSAAADLPPVQSRCAAFVPRRYNPFMFKDHFSADAAGYRDFRPVYPAALFRHLAERAPAGALAWDCATGNGQAARGLLPFFDHVIATDASAAQIEAAESAAGLEFRVAAAEDSGLASAAVDLITVAQALHWFDLDRFYAEVRRVLKPDGVIAVWSYNLLRMSPEIDRVLDAFYCHTLGPYWPPERRWIESAYADLPFPFDQQCLPDFAMTAAWDLDHLMGYLGTWSAVRRYRAALGEDPLRALRADLQRLWGGPGRARVVRWPLVVRLGKVSA